jgi:soluble lytic murein transglycosylase-like protein
MAIPQGRPGFELSRGAGGRNRAPIRRACAAPRLITVAAMILLTLLTLLALAALALAPRGVAQAAAPLAADATAGDPYVNAAHQAKVPLELLVAIAGAESGYHPWALNIAGRQIYCRSRAEAQRLLAANDNVDVGLMQINWRFWGRRLGLSKNDLLEPRTNLLYGARILRQSLDRDGSLWRRISNYHAGKTHERERYNKEVYAAYMRYLRGQVR